MKATHWEFTHRALFFGLIFGCAFTLYAFDHQNSAAALADWLGPMLGIPPEVVARIVFTSAALLLIAAALIRTWASSYLHAEVVYAADVKTASLVADGPYRHVRNPLYLANLLMVIGMGSMMSRVGSVVAVIAMFVFCYRLILREEAELLANQGKGYQAYCRAVPRLWPSWSPRVPPAGHKGNWPHGVEAELWYWGFAAAVLTFAVTLSVIVFFLILGASLLLLWLSPFLFRRGA